MSVGARTASGSRRAGPDRWAVAVAGPDQRDDAWRERSAGSMFLALTGIATMSAACVAIGVGLGWLLDDRTGAPHVFVFVGLALGVVAAVVTTTRTVKRYLGS
jgi:F0F1-type ATP synthase assembly protein I